MRFIENDFLQELNGKHSDDYAINRHLVNLALDICDKQKRYDFFEWKKIMQQELTKYFPNEKCKDLEIKAAEIWVKKDFPDFDDMEKPQHYAHKKRNVLIRIFSNEIASAITIIAYYIITWLFAFYFEHNKGFSYVIYNSPANIVSYIRWIPLLYLCFIGYFAKKSIDIKRMWIAYFVFAGLLGIQTPYIDIGAESHMDIIDGWLRNGVVYLVCTILHLIDYKRYKEGLFLAKNDIKHGLFQ